MAGFCFLGVEQRVLNLLFSCILSTTQLINIIQYNLEIMQAEKGIKKYSKISAALKRCFLESLYFKNLTVKEAASRYQLNYSTAKVIIRDLDQKQKRFVKKLLKLRDAEAKLPEHQALKTCEYRPIQATLDKSFFDKEAENTSSGQFKSHIEIISRVSYDFFGEEEKGQ